LDQHLHNFATSNCIAPRMRHWTNIFTTLPRQAALQLVCGIGDKHELPSRQAVPPTDGVTGI
jgi:hypothetical protein